MGIKFKPEILHILATLFPNMTIKELIGLLNLYV